jgi:uncharacterized membrane protein YcjF (UPF0283 family)
MNSSKLPYWFTFMRLLFVLAFIQWSVRLMIHDWRVQEITVTEYVKIALTVLLAALLIWFTKITVRRWLRGT